MYIDHKVRPTAKYNKITPKIKNLFPNIGQCNNNEPTANICKVVLILATRPTATLVCLPIDQWFENTVKKHCRGKVDTFRYCDDMVVCCQYQQDAEHVKKALAKRLARYKLKMNEDKTHYVGFSKILYRQGKSQGTFDFLGFKFYLGRSRNGVVIPKVRTSGSRIRSKLKKVNQWAKEIRNKYRLKQIWEMFCVKLQGHIRYYGVSFNDRGVNLFLDKAKILMFKWLNRRSQKRSFDWEKFNLFLLRNPLPKVKIYHKLF